MAEVAASLQAPGSLGTFPKPPSPGLARKMTPQRLFHLMSTHVKERSTQSHSSGALDWDPPCSPQPESRTDGAWSRRPSSPAGSKLSPTPGPPVTEGGRASSRGRPYLFLLFFGTLHSDVYIFPFLLCFLLLFFAQLFVRPPQTAILLF